MKSRGEDFEKILKISSSASAIAVSREGAAPSIPVIDEVLDTDAFNEVRLFHKG